mmetsp:Transcript_2628/g.3593  ORF Transcript_2628/g.3593 Transcript_2628/m.3593 type:complete len:81 (-) Transcript_2628:950-1192(-)
MLHHRQNSSPSLMIRQKFACKGNDYSNFIFVFEEECNCENDKNKHEGCTIHSLATKHYLSDVLLSPSSFIVMRLSWVMSI